MRNNLLVKVLSIVVFLLFSCTKSNDINPIPQITFKKMQFFGPSTMPDSALIVIGFVDENGDLGNEDSTTNCVMRYWERINLNNIEFPQFKRTYTLPNLSPDAKNKYISGEIELIIKPAPVFNIFSDSLYFWEVQIWDRAGNASNIVKTPLYDKK